MKNYEEDKHLDTFRDFTRLNENSNVTLKATVTLEQLDTLSRSKKKQSKPIALRSCFG